MKKYYIKNLGCAKNKVDGAAIEAIFSEYLIEKTEEIKDADYIVLNTCGFIQSAKEESIAVFFELVNLKKKSAKLIVAGCLAERFADELSTQLVEADAVLGNYKIDELKLFLKNERIVERVKKKNVQVYGAFRNEDIYKKFTASHFLPSQLYSSENNNTTAYLKIAEGCNHRCSFCAIPQIRGRLVSAGLDDIKKNAIKACKNGAKEINIIAQDPMSYGMDLNDKKINLYSLLDSLLSLPYDFMIRLLYLHPDLFNMKLAEYIALSNERIIPYFDLPFQHANKEILKSMGRSGDKDSYLELIQNIRLLIPDSIIRSTFIIGYPLEDEETLEELEEFIKSAQLDYSAYFVYSNEENTTSYYIKPKHPEFDNDFYSSYVEKLSNIQEQISENRFKKYYSTKQKMIIEYDEGEENGLYSYIGRIFQQCPEVDGVTSLLTKKKLKIGDVVDVKIKDGYSYDFIAEYD